MLARGKNEVQQVKPQHERVVVHIGEGERGGGHDHVLHALVIWPIATLSREDGRGYILNRLLAHRCVPADWVLVRMHRCNIQDVNSRPAWETLLFDGWMIMGHALTTMPAFALYEVRWNATYRLHYLRSKRCCTDFIVLSHYRTWHCNGFSTTWHVLLPACSALLAVNTRFCSGAS